MEKVKLGDITSKLESGGRPKGGATKDGVFSIGGEHLTNNGGFDFSVGKYVPKDYFLKMNGGKIYKNDILIVKDGATTGKTSFVGENFSLQEAAINEHVFRLEINQLKSDPKYCFYFLFSDFGFRQLMADYKGAAIGGISRQILNKVEIPLPSLSEQKSIAAQLDKADELIRYNRQLIEKYDELQQSLFLDMFGDPVMNEKGWEKKELSNFILKLEAGVSVNSDNEFSQYGILKTSCVYSGKFEPNEFKYIRNDEIKRAKINPKANSIIISRMNTEDLVCRCAYVNQNYENLFLPDRLWQTVHTDLPQNILWLSSLLGNLRMMKEIQKKASGTSGSMKNISKKDYLNTKIIYPPISLQNKFASYISSIEYQKELVKEALAKSEDVFNGLLQEFFGE